MSQLIDNALADARARLLHDLAATTQTTPQLVDVLEQALSERREWAQPWPAGAAFITCLVAQDLQESLEENHERWPPCRVDGMHQLHVEPALGEDPQWVCEDCSVVVAHIGDL
jgi:hypothetical protein